MIRPQRYQETKAILDASKKPLIIRRPSGGRLSMPVFNGSQNNRRNKKRPITLAERA